jgi:hypothetical protein
MKRLLATACLFFAAVGTWGVSGHGVVHAAGGGNSDAAHACQHGGYADLIGTDGVTDTTFRNTGECVSYAAHGGTLVKTSAAAPCLNGGYAHLAPAGSQSAFTSEAACVFYVGQGGTPVALSPTFVLTSPGTILASSNHCWAGESNVKVNLPALWDSGTSGYPGAVLCFQADGNLVIYQAGHVGDPAYAPWYTHTQGHPEAQLVFQADGNLVIYSGVTPLWNTGTQGHPGDCVVFQGDGNLVVYSSCG